MTTQRAASCTVDVDKYVFIFINRPNTDFIDYVRFDESDPTNAKTAESGKIGTKDGPISASSGPMSCVAMKTQSGQETKTDLRLYFVVNGTLREARYPCAGPKSNLKNGWVVLKENTEDRVSIMGKAGLDQNVRAIDQTSYMSSGKTSKDHLPYIVWQVSGQATTTRFAFAAKTNDQIRWDSKALTVELLPAN